MGERLTVRAAAERIGISTEVARRQVRKLGVAVGDDGLIDLSEFIDERARGLDRSRQRGAGDGAHLAQSTNLKRLQADRLELRIARERGELVRRVDVERALTTAGQKIRDAALAVPARAAQDLAGVTDPVEIKRILAEHMRAFLDAYANDLEEQAFGETRDDDDVDA